MILDTAGNKGGASLIRWVPFHLSFVMSRLATKSGFPLRYRHLAGDIGKLCDNLRDSKSLSGEGWETLFVLFLLARCLTGSPDDYFVPRQWFLEHPNVLYNQPCESTKQRLFGECENWAQLLEGVSPGTKPQLSILYPTHACFKNYDVLAVYSKDGKTPTQGGNCLDRAFCRR